MIKFYIKFYLIILLPLSSWSQEHGSPIEVTYISGYKNYRDTTNTAPQILKYIEHRLFATNNEARFEFIPNFYNDSKTTDSRFRSRGVANGVYYKRIGDSLKLHQYESPLDKTLYLIKKPFNEYDWVITKETKDIIGYLCYKAYTEYSYEFPNPTGGMDLMEVKIVVWFTPELNYPVGPAGFDGLPGLVLEKYSGSFYFIASKIIFKEPSDVSLNLKPEKGIPVTQAEYDVLNKKAYEELIKNKP